MTNEVLISILLFVFMGYLVERANLIEKLFKSCTPRAGPSPAHSRSPPWSPARFCYRRRASSALSSL